MAVLANMYTPAATFISPRERVILREKNSWYKTFHYKINYAKALGICRLQWFFRFYLQWALFIGYCINIYVG